MFNFSSFSQNNSNNNQQNTNQPGFIDTKWQTKTKQDEQQKQQQPIQFTFGNQQQNKEPSQQAAQFGFSFLKNIQSNKQNNQIYFTSLYNDYYPGKAQRPQKMQHKQYQENNQSNTGFGFTNWNQSNTQFQEPQSFSFNFGFYQQNQQSLEQKQKLTGKFNIIVGKFQLMKNYKKVQFDIEEWQQYKYQTNNWINNNIIIVQDLQKWYRYVFKISEHVQITSTYNDNKYKQTPAMWLASQGIIPPKQWYHGHLLRDINGNTVAMLLAQNQVIPPKQWEHDAYIKNNKQQTVNDILSQVNKDIKVPQQWISLKTVSNTQYQFDSAKNGNIPQRNSYDDCEIVNQDCKPVAVLLAEKGVIPSKEWCYFNNQNYKNCKQIDGKYIENHAYYNNFYEQIKDNLIQNYCPVPDYIENYNFDKIIEYVQKQDLSSLQQYKSDTKFKDGWTIAMLIVKVLHCIPFPAFNHDPQLTNDRGMTVAFLLANSGIIPPYHWGYNEKQSSILLAYKDTDYNQKYRVAFELAKNGIIPPKLWIIERIEKLVDNQCNTIGMYLAQKGIDPSLWYQKGYSITQTNNKGQSILSLLQQHGYVWEDENFVQYI